MLLAILASPSIAPAQPDKGDSAARETAFIETLRREGPAPADRFIALRDARRSRRSIQFWAKGARRGRTPR